jgi:hypothetical protein
MKSIDKLFMIFLKNYFNCSENELMNNLKKFTCKRNFTCNFSFENIQKDEFYYIIKKNNLYHVVLENTLIVHNK